MESPHSKEVDQLEQELSVSLVDGLSSAQVDQLRAKFGSNGMHASCLRVRFSRLKRCAIRQKIRFRM